MFFFYYLIYSISVFVPLQIIHETIRSKKRKRLRRAQQPQIIPVPTRKSDYDKEYYVIGVMLFLAGAVKVAEFALFVINDERIRKK